MRDPLLLALLLAVAGPAHPEPALESPRLLAPGTVLEQSLEPGGCHSYAVELETGEIVHNTLSPVGIDLVARVSAPSGRRLVEIDTAGQSRAIEVVSIVAEEPGHFLIEICQAPAGTVEGRYRLAIEPPQPATPEDRLRVAAEWATADALRHARLRTPEDLIHAEALYGRALTLRKRLGDRAGEAAVLEDLGRVDLLRGDAAAALSRFEASLALRRASEDRRGVASALNQSGRALRRLAHNERALAAFTESLALWQVLDDPEQEASVLNNLAILHQEMGKPDQAAAALQRSLAVYRRLGSLPGEANALNNLGFLSARAGRPAEAVASYEQALGLARRLGNRALEADVLNNLGDVFEASGRLQRALEHLLAARAVVETLGDPVRQATVLNNLGNLLLDLGAVEEGRQMLVAALGLQTEKRRQATTLTNLARAERLLGNPEKAREHLDRSLSLQREAKDSAGEAFSLHRLGLLALDAGRPEEAAELLTTAVATFRQLGNRDLESAALAVLGRARAAGGDPQASNAHFAEALRLAEAQGDADELSYVLRERARALDQLGDLEGSRRDLESAIGHLESTRAEVSGGRLRATFLASVRDTYESYVDVLLRLHETRQEEGLTAPALAAAERSRARSLLDFLARSEIEIAQGDPALRAEEQRLRQELAARANLRLDLLRDAGKTEELAAVDKEIESLSAEHRLLEARLRAGDPRYAALEDPSIDVAAVRTLLGEDTVLLEYSLGDPRSWLWVVTQDSLKTFELPGRARIEELALRVHEHLRSPNPAGAGDERADLDELSRRLLGAALPEIGDKRLAIVADGALQHIPFAALPVPAPDGGTVPLVVRHEVVHLPSAAVLREIRRAAAGRPRPEADLAILADPVYESTDPRVRSAAKRPAATSVEAQAAQATPAPAAASPTAEDVLRSLRGTTRAESLARLSWSRREAERIAAAAEGRDLRLALDFQASRDLALSPDLRRYKILHFATHGFLDADHPELSGLALSQWDEQGQPRDGFLRLQDVYNLELRADLVVLSGCETALGKRLRGEGFLSLTHGFLHAGASGVVASLWEVRDRTTAELMERFYRALYRDGLAPAAALRAAQVSLWKERAWRDPYYWAAFTMQGDWR